MQVYKPQLPRHTCLWHVQAYFTDFMTVSWTYSSLLIRFLKLSHFTSFSLMSRITPSWLLSAFRCTSNSHTSITYRLSSLGHRGWQPVSVNCQSSAKREQRDLLYSCSWSLLGPQTDLKLFMQAGIEMADYFWLIVSLDYYDVCIFYVTVYVIQCYHSASHKTRHPLHF